MNKDYYTTRGYQRPDRPDSGARWFVLGVVVMLLVIGFFLLTGITR